MKLAVFTPLNPARCGVSDYSEALLPRLVRHCEIEVFVDNYQPIGFNTDGRLKVRPSTAYEPHDFDATIYHIGNNPYHTYAYERALEHPGIVVLHEFNLHHLVADATIKRGDWDQYLQEVNYNGGPADVAHAERVRKLEVGPDYDGLAMNRRLLERSRALVVHSRYLANQVRQAGFSLPVRKIPHGASIPEVNRNAWRGRLGLSEDNPLIGIFGFLKPYKRIPECLRAMKRLVHIDPRVRMILVGEEHPDLPIRRLASQFDLNEHVRVLGYVPIDQFEQLIGAVDICLNLRYPTAGETSGTLLRALGLGRAVVVSDVGAFSELPDDVCFKVPVGDGEVDTLTETLSRLTAQPELAAALGRRAREYVASECSWDHVADLYADWIRAVVEGRAGSEDSDRGTRVADEAAPAEDGGTHPSATASDEAAVLAAGFGDPPEEAFFRDSDGAASPDATKTDRLRTELAAYILGVEHDPPDPPDPRPYIERHLARLVRTLEITPPGSKDRTVLEMGAYMQITPALATKLGYGEVRGSYLGPLGTRQHKRVRLPNGENFECAIDLFDAEKDPYPYADESFSTVLCCELLEHLHEDPMHMMGEINRILKPGGHLVLSTPNICSLRAVGAVLLGYHPGLFHQYIKPNEQGDVEPRHSREYTPRDVQQLLEAAGFSVERLETGPYAVQRTAEYEWVKHVIRRYDVPSHLRGEAIYAVGKKINGVEDRYPLGLYSGGES